MTTRLAADRQAPAAARSFVARELATSPVPKGVLVDDVVLIVSELVTNAVRAGAAWVDLDLHVSRRRLDLIVEDDAGGWPVPVAADDEAVGGRGLGLVDRLADTWEVTARTKGKRVTVTWLERVDASR